MNQHRGAPAPLRTPVQAVEDALQAILHESTHDLNTARQAMWAAQGDFHRLRRGHRLGVAYARFCAEQAEIYHLARWNEHVMAMRCLTAARGASLHPDLPSGAFVRAGADPE